MATRERDHMADMDEDDDRDEEVEQLLVCLDMLRGSSALLRQHKAGLAGLLPSRGWKARRALERLVADLTDVLSATGSMAAGTQQQSRSQQQQQRQLDPARTAAGRGGGVEAGGVKRPRGGQAAQARSSEKQQEEKEEQPLQRGEGSRSSSSSALLSSVRADPLGLPEVVERVISFAEGREMLGRLSRVCRLWRRVSEGEKLCLRVVEQHMPCALLGGEESLHARLGGSARRCLQVHNASLTSGRLLSTRADFLEREVVLLTEVYMGRTLLRAACGAPEGPTPSERAQSDLHIFVPEPWGESQVPFSAASLGFDDIRDVFDEEGYISVRVLVMDKTTGVTASLWQGPFVHDNYHRGMEAGACLLYKSMPMTITSTSYNGPLLQVQLTLFVELCEELNQEEGEEEDDVLSDRERQWKIGGPILKLMGQPFTDCERFIRTRLAEEAMAAKQQGR